MMMPSNSEPEVIAQTENFVIWTVQDADGEPLYHLDINNLVVRFFTEEWEEFKTFAAKFAKNPKADADGVIAETEAYYAGVETSENEDTLYTIDVTGATIYLYEEDFKELYELLREL